jgi:regulator of CtrA degradation
VQRAVREKDMKVEEAGDEKFRLSAPTKPHPVEPGALPAELSSLIERSRNLYERVWRLDEALYSAEVPTGDNPVMKQLSRLRSAAESGAFDPLAVWREK